MSWRQVLVAVDGGAPAWHALEVAREFCRQHDLRLKVVLVLREAESVPALLRACTPAILYGEPGVEIARHAENSGSDLIVLGRRALRFGTQVALGTTAEAVLRRARVPCLIIPEGQRDFAHVVVALDGSERGMEVLDQVDQNQRVLDGGMELITVEPPNQGDNWSMLRGRTLRLADAVENRRRASGGGLPRLQVRWGEPTATLRNELCHPGRDLLVLGARRGPRGPSHSTGTGRALLHSVLSAVLTIPL